MAHDFSRIASEFMRALRGRRSQLGFSRRLGYRTNVAYTWESGRAWPTAARALSAAARTGIDVQAALAQFYRASPAWLSHASATTPEGVAALLDDLRGRTSVVDLARAAGRSRFAVSRWLKGEAEPRLPDFLLMLETSSLRLLDFLGAFTDPAKMPSVSKAWAQLEAARRAAYEVPWTQAVLRLLELTEYQALRRHGPGWIASRLGISVEEEQRCLRLLMHAGQIRQSQGRYRLRDVLAVDTRSDPQAELLRVKTWWTQVALERQTGAEDSVFSYNVFAVSERDLARIRDLYRAYFRQVRSLISESQPSERVALISVQLVELDRAKSGKPARTHRHARDT
jgi:transcriptional regulator with XRE-family HTH domain